MGLVQPNFYVLHEFDEQTQAGTGVVRFRLVRGASHVGDAANLAMQSEGPLRQIQSNPSIRLPNSLHSKTRRAAGTSLRGADVLLKLRYARFC